MENNLSLLIKPTSSSCNLKCSYCFYNDVSNNRKNKNYGMMTIETAKKIIDRIIEYTTPNATINIGFQGGEPTLIGLDFFKEFIKYAAVKKVKRTFNYSLQTNGILIDDKWCKFFKRNKFLIGLSLDGYESNMNLFRYDNNGLGVFNKVITSYNLLKSYKVDINLLCVLTNPLAQSPEKLYGFFKSIDASYIQLIPCLPPLDTNEKFLTTKNLLNKPIHEEIALTPDNYKAFYKKFYSLWLKDFKIGKAISVNIFDNIMLMLMRKPPFQCGVNGRCSIQNIIEADGSVFTCDFYVTDTNNLGNIHTNTFYEINNCNIALEFKKPLKLPYICEKCKYVHICNGGCKRQRVCFLEENSCGYKDLLDTMMIELPSTLSKFLKFNYIHN